MVALPRFFHEFDHSFYGFLDIQIPEKVSGTFDLDQNKPFIIDKGADVFFNIRLSLVLRTGNDQCGEGYLW